MISKVLFSIERGYSYVKKHPQLLFTFLLVIIIPLAFLFSGQQFIKAGKANTDTLYKDRIGAIHDVFSSLILATDFDNHILQTEIEKMSQANSDITKFRIVVIDEGELIPIAALNQDKIGVPETSVSLYEQSIPQPTGIAVPLVIDNVTFFQTFRALKSENSVVGYIFIEFSRGAIDTVFAKRILEAYLWLIGIIAIIFVLLYRHVRLIDYGYLYRESKKANELKDLFTNMIAHELRAPLTAIRGYASLISEAPDVRPATKEHSLRISKASERLITIVSDLLDVARIQSGKLKVVSEEFDVAKVVDVVIEEIQPSAEKKAIGLSAVGTENPIHITGDQKRMHQALINLISNAIKYTKQGSITVSIEEKYEVIEIRIQDTGMGISAKDQKELFAPFFRAQGDQVSEITGTGLGMWITKQLVELMGGTIAVESIKGVGTHVVVQMSKNI